MDSLWTDTVKLDTFPTLKKNTKTDVLIIGGGMAGILCAYLLRQAGIDYMLVEAKRIASGITKNTTAKITIQHGLIYDKLLQSSMETAALYLAANKNALHQFDLLCQHMDCDYELQPSYLYTLRDKAKLEAELHALHHLGYPAEYVERLPLPMPTLGAVKFPDQAQFHPLKFIRSITPALHIYEQTKVLELEKASSGSGYTVFTEDGQIKADRVVVATHFPIFNTHGAYFLKMHQSRSYVLALQGAQKLQGMYRDENPKGLSFRSCQDDLLLGGGSHRTGEKGGNWAELMQFAKQYYPQATISFYWATQDCMTLDGIPYIGPYKKGAKDFFVMTGFNKWGMTSSMVAALLIRDLLMGNANAYAKVFDPARTMLHPQLFINAAKSTKNLLTPSMKRCPHMGCALKWNPEEHTWDCPCHGSRFTKEGELIDNPATDDL